MEDPREICGPIAHIYRSHLAYMAKELEDYGIGSGQFDFLMVLYRKDGISQEALAKILKNKQSHKHQGDSEPGKRGVCLQAKR
ncbi:MarR family winged helix-turn-helix transcriptional regulator [Methanosarcina mazei]|uniref:MarR family winged helix-turn-helix transcriptional regulator n=1 Tax=Methanosarcina mazei TaxID=2209 RepID=UPI00255230B0|nr:MarR family winged helix-turn-helix transcriptional regulator [Methanosarcina mazei]WIM43099.1 MarR family winged helix-turn-helix transcriptional regulator [Methanosarcina mazei]WIM46563.1 MarR family winged helix-turn-helix transcriptional regulator [Methanosarcina mazei]